MQIRRGLVSTNTSIRSGSLGRPFRFFVNEARSSRLIQAELNADEGIEVGQKGRSSQRDIEVHPSVFQPFPHSPIEGCAISTLFNIRNNFSRLPISRISWDSGYRSPQ
jgi:hypothetical protein